MTGLKKYLTGSVACLFYGASIALAYSPFDIAVIAVLSPALLFYCWLHSNTPSETFRHGYLFGIGMFGAGVYWLHISINLFGGVNLAGAIFITLLLVAFLALYPAITGYLAKKYFTKPEPYFLMMAIPTLWVLVEWVRSWMLTGFPWLNLGYSHVDTPLNGLAPILGIYGVGLASVITSSMLVVFFNSGKKRQLVMAAGIVMIWGCCWLCTTVNWTSEIKPDYKVALVQGAVPQAIKWNPEMLQPSMDIYLGLSSSHWQGDLIIWPETAIPSYLHFQQDFIKSLQEKAISTNTDFITGLVEMDTDAGKYYNSMLLLNAGTSSYYKRHLVPFGEYMPVAFILKPLLNFLKIPMSDFSPGNKDDKPLLYGTGAVFGASICYEDAFGEEVIEALPEANVLVNITNDAWFGDSIAPHQHLQMARMRSLETGRYMLRATNTGITAIIDEKGKIATKSRQFEQNSLSATVSLYEGTTPYARFGNWPVIILLLVTLAGLIYSKSRITSNKL